MSIYQWQKAAAAIFFPTRHCLNCNGLAPGEPLCARCREQSQALRRCPNCAIFISLNEAPHYLCSHCREQQPLFAAAYAALPYQDKIREQLTAFKYHQRTGLRRPLAALLVDLYQQFYQGISFDAIVPVPVSAAKFEQRGYNQAQLLSDIVAKETAIAHQPQLLQRVEDTPPLFELTRKERIAALSKAFAATKAAKAKTILLVDDIYTTGATAHNCSKALLSQGAKQIYYLSVAAARDLP